MKFSTPVPTAIVVALLPWLASCVSSPVVSPSAPPAVAPLDLSPGLSLPDDRAEARGVLLLLSDRRTYDPSAVALALASPDSETRRQLALALGRIGDPRGATALERLLADDDVVVRRTAVFALGILGARESAVTVWPLVVGEDRELGVLAVEALARMGARLDAVVDRLLAGSADELLPRLVPSLWRFDDPAVVRWAAQGLEEDDADVRELAAFALERAEVVEGRDALRSALRDLDPRVRSRAARGLGRVGERSDVERLRDLLDDEDPGPVVQALRGARRIVDSGEAAAPSSWVARLVELSEHEHPGVRTSVLEVAGAWRGEPLLEAVLRARFDAGEPRERELALIALAEARSGGVAARIAEAKGAPDAGLREAAVVAAGFVGAVGVVEELAADPAPRVRIAALRTLRLARPETSAELLRVALSDEDFAVRAAALEILAEDPILPVAELAAGYGLAWRDRSPEPRTAAVLALSARARASEDDLEAATDELRRLTLDAELSVRRAAVAALVDLEEPAPELGAVAGRESAEVYVDIARRTAGPRDLLVETDRGPLRIRLDCPTAPLSCLHVVQLARQGFYDGSSFHRVVPEFVIQGGDPRGDGYGGPGFTLRDEPSPTRFERGVVGLALASPDTGGSQFFVALERQPHLDGEYTVVGRVVEGADVLERIRQGDRMLRVVEPGS